MIEFYVIGQRVRDARLALTGKLKPRIETKEVEVVVPGEPHRVSLYQVGFDRNPGGGYWIIDFGDGSGSAGSKARYYLTCEEAHRAEPGQSVTKVEGIRIGNKYLTGKLREVSVNPKPKRAKGAK